jgi:hypothetical protein
MGRIILKGTNMDSDILVDMRSKKILGGSAFIHKIKGYVIWKVLSIDKAGKIKDNFTFKDEILATEKFEDITEID